LPLQNETALMSCQIRAVEHRKRAAGMAGAHLVVCIIIIESC